MTFSNPTPRNGAQSRPLRHASARRLAVAAIALVTVVVAVWGWQNITRTVIIGQGVQILVAYLVLWLPMLAAVAYAMARPAPYTRTSVVRLRIAPIDVLWGIGIGLIARGIASLYELTFYGRTASGGLVLEITPGWWWFAIVIAPVVLAPLIEELYFRGLLLRAVQNTTRTRSPRVAASVAVLITAVIFGLLHTLDASTPTSALVVGLAATTMALFAGTLTVLTNRIGGAMIAHVVYNGTLVWLIING